MTENKIKPKNMRLIIALLVIVAIAEGSNIYLLYFTLLMAGLP